jgi:hypothetical protein
MAITLKPCLPEMKPQEAGAFRQLTVVSLAGGGPRFQDYLLASEAIEAGLLTVTEVSESGSVPELLAVNEADRPVLLLDGEELQGARQNRILNTTVLLPARCKTRIPVSCVEAGRWQYNSATFRAGHYAPSSLRQVKSRDVQQNLRTEGRAASNQGAVWDSVGEQIRAHHVPAPTAAMSEVLSQRADTIAEYQAALPYRAGACGVVAAITGRFVAADVFDSPATLQAVWPRLLASYAMDAEVATRKAAKSFTAKGAGEVLAHACEQECTACPTVGMGQDLRFQAPDMLGQALVVDTRAIHASIFPTAKGRQDQRPVSDRIAPPSRRRPRG